MPQTVPQTTEPPITGRWDETVQLVDSKEK